MRSTGFHRDEGPEVTQSIAVTFVESGDFEIFEAKDHWIFSKSDVLLSVPGTVRTYRHYLACPTDVCLTLSYAPEIRLPTQRVSTELANQ